MEQENGSGSGLPGDAQPPNPKVPRLHRVQEKSSKNESSTRVADDQQSNLGLRSGSASSSISGSASSSASGSISRSASASGSALGSASSSASGLALSSTSRSASSSAFSSGSSSTSRSASGSVSSSARSSASSSARSSASSSASGSASSSASSSTSRSASNSASSSASGLASSSISRSASSSTSRSASSSTSRSASSSASNSASDLPLLAPFDLPRLAPLDRRMLSRFSLSSGSNLSLPLAPSSGSTLSLPLAPSSGSTLSLPLASSSESTLSLPLACSSESISSRALGIHPSAAGSISSPAPYSPMGPALSPTSGPSPDFGLGSTRGSLSSFEPTAVLNSTPKSSLGAPLRSSDPRFKCPEWITRLEERVKNKIIFQRIQREAILGPAIAEAQAAHDKRVQFEEYMRANLRPLDENNRHILIVAPRNLEAEEQRRRRDEEIREQLEQERRREEELREQREQERRRFEEERRRRREQEREELRLRREEQDRELRERFCQQLREQKMLDEMREETYRVNRERYRDQLLRREWENFDRTFRERRKHWEEQFGMHLKAVKEKPQEEEERLNQEPGERQELQEGVKEEEQRELPVQEQEKHEEPEKKKLKQEIQGNEQQEENGQQVQQERPMFVPMSRARLASIRATLQGPPDQILITKFNQEIRRRDVQTLGPGSWLNDEIINFYLNLLMERSEQRAGELPSVYVYNTFFVERLSLSGFQGVKRWTRRVDIFSKDILLVPTLYEKQVWCLVVIDMRFKAIRYFDSLKKTEPNPVLSLLLSYLQDESQDKRNQVLDVTDFSIGTEANLPVQRNNYDSGVFACMFAENTTRNEPIKFTQADMTFFRQMMIAEIARGKLFQ